MPAAPRRPASEPDPVTAPVTAPLAASAAARRAAAPRAQSARQALGSHAPLAALLERVRASEARLAVILPLLPAGLAGAVRAGPLDEQAWVLLADHAAAAARLRLGLPAIEAALARAGWQGPQVVVKVRPRT